MRPIQDDPVTQQSRRGWRIIEIDRPEENDLTDSELIGLSILAAHQSRESEDMPNVYYRACKKIQPQVAKATEGRDE